jgi:hypothetical protein
VSSGNVRLFYIGVGFLRPLRGGYYVIRVIVNDQVLRHGGAYLCLHHRLQGEGGSGLDRRTVGLYDSRTVGCRIDGKVGRCGVKKIRR